MLEEDLKEPNRRNWLSFWSLVAMQVTQSFNVNAVKFILVALGVLLIKQNGAPKGVEHLVTVMLVLPYVLFAPTCGWLSDRYAKSTVIRWTSWMQIAALAFIAWALHAGHLMWGIWGFFLVATQAALLSPSKLGVVKELVGGQRLGFASGVMEGTVILAILAGQIIGGTWFDARVNEAETNGFAAAITPIWWLVFFALLSVGMAHLVQKSAKHPSVPLSWKMATSHVRDIRELFITRKLRLCGMGVGFFWGFGGFIALAVLQIAEEMHGGGNKGTATTFAHLWTMAVIGIAAGSVTAGIISRRHIEMGLAPLGGVLMTVGTLALGVMPNGSIWQKIVLVLAGAGGAAFLVPLQAVLQDAPAEDRRGTVISASNLLNNLSGIFFTALQFGLKYTGVSIGMQFVVLGVLALGVTLVAFRHLGTDLIRLVGLTLVRTLYRVRVTGHENVPKEGGVLLLPNHVTWADSFFISAASPRPVRFIMDATFMRNKWVASFCRIFQTVPIDRSNPREAIRITAEALKNGDVLCLFPEGQLTRTGTLCELQRGFELIARMAKAPVIPMWSSGSWGSIFSFERGQFFRKIPYRIPHHISVAFAPAIPAKDASVELVRDQMLEASAAAIAARFDSEAESAEPEITTNPLWINGYQIGQINALPRRQAFATLAADAFPDSLFALTTVLPELFESDCLTESTFRADASRSWVGGDILREVIASARDASVIFFDFSADALIPLERPGLIHCPCLAIDGLVISMSMPDPVQPLPTSEPQPGRRTGSWGKLLPGFFLRTNAAGETRVHGPSTPAEGVLLPAGASLDAGGFLVAPSA